jgi:ribosomal protein L37E
VTEPTPLHDQKRNNARIECRKCGFTFGRLSADRRHPAFTPGLHMIVDTTLQRVDVICPRCGQRRSFTDIVFSAMAIAKVPKVPVEAG